MKKIKHNNSLTPLKEIISLLNKDKLPFDIDDGRIWSIWKKLVGDSISEHARPVWIRNQILMVHVSSPIWIQELRYRQEEIKTHLNNMLGREAIKQIKFRVG